MKQSCKAPSEKSVGTSSTGQNTTSDLTYSKDPYTGVERYGWMPVFTPHGNYVTQGCVLSARNREEVERDQGPRAAGGRLYVNVGRPGYIPPQRQSRTPQPRFPIERRFVSKGLGFAELLDCE